MHPLWFYMTALNHAWVNIHFYTRIDEACVNNKKMFPKAL